MQKQVVAFGEAGILLSGWSDRWIRQKDGGRKNILQNIRRKESIGAEKAFRAVSIVVPVKQSSKYCPNENQGGLRSATN